MLVNEAKRLRSGGFGLSRAPSSGGFGRFARKNSEPPEADSEVGRVQAGKGRVHFQLLAVFLCVTACEGFF